MTTTTTTAQPHTTAPQRNTRHRTPAIAAALAATLTVLMALAGCSSPDTSPAEAKKTPGSEEQEYSATTVTRRFLSCLVEHGLDARIVDDDRVGLLQIGWDGNMVQPVVTYGPDGNTTQGWSTGNEYPNIHASGVSSSAITGEDFPYIIPMSANQLANSPYADRQDDWAECEQRNPEFSQNMEFGSAKDERNATDEDKAAALAFARDCRGKGFAWVADPKGAHPLSIEIPVDVPEKEVREFFRQCPTDADSPVIIFWNGDYPYDINAVRDVEMP